MNNYLFLALWVLLWSVLTFILHKYFERKSINLSKIEAKQIIKEAKNESKQVINEWNKEKNKIILEAENKKEEIIEKSRLLEEKLLNKEEKLENKLEEISQKQENLFKKETNLDEKTRKISKREEEIEQEISKISGLSKEEAKEIYLEQISKIYDKDAISWIEKRKKHYLNNEKEIAKDIILKSIQQYCWDVTNEVTTTVISLENDDIKWRLIWKEWRNIIAFEKAAWVSLIIDDTPDTVFISSFDLYRRYIAKVSLEKLIEDKRIQPARIEEIVESTTLETNDLLLEIWQKAVEELWISSLPEEIIRLVWKLRFRTSFGQNILKHSTEMAYIAESIAKDLWMDSQIIKAWALLHDIWKALDHDIEWTHPEIWARVARKYWLDERIVDMIENHHWEPTIISKESCVIQVADAISSVRPWARRESVELYVKRLKELEGLVQSFSWVTKAYALSAWREVRVFVDCDVISDSQAVTLSSEIASSIEENLNYPWEIKVNVIRENRIINYAK